MADYDNENWMELYKSALVELEHAKMAGRIGAARVEIVARIEKLRSIPGLHSDEHHAIDDAVRSLRFLEEDEARHGAELHRQALERAEYRLRSISRAIPVPNRNRNTA